MRKKHIPLFFIMAIFAIIQLDAQRDSLGWGSLYPEVDERKLIETKWRYTYAVELESNTIIHKAESYYDYYLHFRYDYRYEQYLNGKMTRGNWSLNGSELFYSFKNIKKFEVAEINNKTLVLEFKQANSKGTFQYHFIKVESKDAPFIKPANELPDVIVERIKPKKERRGWFASKSKKKKKKNKRKKGQSLPEVKEEYISIELIGGGFYGGIDPVLRDYIQIKSDGRLIKEFKSQHQGLIVTKKNIPREELELFAEFIQSKNFFEFERIYDCESSWCQERKQEKPRPVPLRLAVAYGTKKKVITISIFGKDRSKVKYIDYPPALDNIIDAIQRMAHRIETL